MQTFWYLPHMDALVPVQWGSVVFRGGYSVSERGGSG